MKRFLLAFILIICTLVSSFPSSYVYAENESKIIKTDDGKKTDKNDEKKEKKHSPIAEHMLVCDVESGFEVYSKNADKAINPYGLVKILTAICVIESVENLDKEITVPENILKNYDYDNGNIGLASGEVISIKNLLYAMIMQDAGDCALALSHVVGKSQKDFITLMNDTAKRAGATNSKFTDPAGFPESKQETTLRDLAKISSYALKNEVFAEMVKTQRLQIPPNNKSTYGRVMFSTNKFLSRFYSEDYFDTRIKGVKGYYKDEKDTGLIIRYTSGNDDLLVLTAKSEEADGENLAYKDTLYLIEKGKGYFTKKVIVDKEEFVSEAKLRNAKGTDRVLIISLSDIVAKLPKDYDTALITKEVKLADKLDAPLAKYGEIGEINVYYDGFKIGSAKVASYSEIDRSIFKVIKNTIIDFIFSIYFLIILAVAAGVVYLKRKKKK